MAAGLQMFLFLFKSKYRRKNSFWCNILCLMYLCVMNVFSDTNCSSVHCVNGQCQNGTGCVCFEGWQGEHCQFCGGKVRLSNVSGSIHDGHGNYSVDVKCSWLVDAGGDPGTTIRLHFEEFATECGWDYLYIFDGDSVHSPLLAVFSGLMYKDHYRIRRVPEIVAHSGAALLHFYSDVAYNMTGFNITYSFNTCPSRYSNQTCSGHGICIDRVCTCDAMYTGEACDVLVCPNNCSFNGQCNREEHRCDCFDGFRGEDCNQIEQHGYWEVVRPKNFDHKGTASHSAIVWRDSLYIIGGESYNTAKLIYVYDFNGNVWETLHMDSKNTPRSRYGHSAVLFGDKIYIYGGVEDGGFVSSELWAFDVSSKVWENIKVRVEPCNTTTANGTALCGPLKSAGHSATVITANNQKRMIVIFGHSPESGYLNTVQEYHFGTREWSIIITSGYPVIGGYGHSSAWDPLSQKIYVYGGYVADGSSSPYLSSSLFSYDPISKTWVMLMYGPSARFLHTATFVSPGTMLVFGGNTHNDTAHSMGAKCYSSDILIYDITCNSWNDLPVPGGLQADLARYGHSAVIFEGSLYIYGGFNGQMLSDMLKFTPGKCDNLATQSACLNSHFGVKCVWNSGESKCQSIKDAPLSSFSVMSSNEIDIDSKDEESVSHFYSFCPEEKRSSRFAFNDLCSSHRECVSCIHVRDCLWCGNETCSYKHCCDSNRLPDLCPNRRHPQPCDLNSGPVCHQIHSCHACNTFSHCQWLVYESRCSNLTANRKEPPVSCPATPTCADFTSCRNCTGEECIWCHNEGKCVDKNAYPTSFPYGQCREWTTHKNKCRSSGPGKSTCNSYFTCSDCRADPACGWCDDGSGTGLGTCLPGGNNGPDSSHYVCSPDHWFFTCCPACQCNGHSICGNDTGICIQPCANLTHGPHCEHCIPGYYGNPVNGGRCIPCECNGQGTECNPETGKCFCTTKGITGDHCERCDTQNHYHGDPTNKGSCFYDLTIDYQFTFNLSKKEDRHYTQINFKNSPPKADIDADFTISCSVLAKMNITIKTANSPEQSMLSDHNCTTFRSRFFKSEHIFGVEDNITLTTFYVYVYDLHPPLWIQISFSQYPKLNLQQFFITFSTCFLLLLLVAAILWKIKQKYDMYRRRQRLFVEMEQMASRPFAQVLIEFEIETLRKNEENSDCDTTAVSIKKTSPSPIALEPCYGYRAAVLSLLVRLPRGRDSAYTPTGHSGIAIASALVTLGNTPKVSIDPTTKCDTKSKSRKSLTSQHPESCI